MPRRTSAAQRCLQVSPPVSMRFVVVAFALASVGCQAPQSAIHVGVQSTRSALLEGVVAKDSVLAMSSFVAEMQFVFPQQSAEIIRSLLRTELAHREAERLGIQLPRAAVESAMNDFETSLLQGLGGAADLEAWSLAQHQQSWAQVRPQYERRLAANLLYQVVLRADAIQYGRAQMWWLLSSTEQQANEWARSLRGGRAPSSLLEESLLPGPEPDGSYPPLATYLPGQAGELLQTASAGQVLGPLQLQGDQSWMVGRVIALLPAQDRLPPVAVLLQGIQSQPVGPLEARAWFEEMSRRYTARATFAPISAPLEAFVPIR